MYDYNTITINLGSFRRALGLFVVSVLPGHYMLPPFVVLPPAARHIDLDLRSYSTAYCSQYGALGTHGFERKVPRGVDAISLTSITAIEK